jgi:hypothetical protein
MIRFLLRFFGVLCLALGFILLVYDGTKWIADQRLHATKVSEVWASVEESSLAKLQPMVERVAPWLWDPITLGVLNAPGWLVLLVFGSLLLLLGRKKRPLIGYAR